MNTIYDLVGTWVGMKRLVGLTAILFIVRKLGEELAILFEADLELKKIALKSQLQ